MANAMARAALIVAAFLLASPAFAQGAGIVAPGAQWEELPRMGKQSAEGVVAARDGKIYAVDITNTPNPADNPGGTIFRYDPKTKEMIKFMEPSGMAMGLHIEKSGDMLIAQGAYGGKRAVVRLDLATSAQKVLADSYQGKKLNAPNDLTTDAKGRIYFTDALYNDKGVMELPNAVYRLDPDGKLTQIIADILRPNGIELSPDGKRLYVAASNTPRLQKNPNGPEKDAFGISMGGVVAYDLDDAGNLSNGKLLYRNDEMLVDGTAIDTEGNLYLAMHDNPKHAIVVLSPAGKMLEDIPVPGPGTATNLGFGRGEEAGMLYLTMGAPWRMFRIKTTKTGFYQ
jgi:gluconolactonase